MNGDLKPFEPGTLNLPDRRTLVKQLLTEFGISKVDAIKQAAKLMRDEVWLSDEYQVNIDRQTSHGFGDAFRVWHLSIKRRDKAPIHDWRDLQAIKNMLVGPEYEALELYPAESRLADSANQFHLWVLTNAKGEPVRLPFGWTQRNVTSRPLGNAVQRPLPESVTHHDPV